MRCATTWRRCASPGSLRLLDRRRPMTLATVVHAVDRLRGRLREGVDAWDAIVATAAPVMLTGTPRALALAAIAAHEAGPRGWYGGLVVEVRASGRARVGTMLRAAAVRDGVAEVRTGGDLLADSDPAREELESRIKAVSLWRALGLAVADDLQRTVADGPAAPDRPSAALPKAVALHDGGDAVRRRAGGNAAGLRPRHRCGRNACRPGRRRRRLRARACGPGAARRSGRDRRRRGQAAARRRPARRGDGAAARPARQLRARPRRPGRRGAAVRGDALRDAGARRSPDRRHGPRRGVRVRLDALAARRGRSAARPGARAPIAPCAS